MLHIVRNNKSSELLGYLVINMWEFIDIYRSGGYGIGQKCANSSNVTTEDSPRQANKYRNYVCVFGT